MTTVKRLILVEVYINADAEENDLHLTEDEIFDDVYDEIWGTVHHIRNSKYFGSAGVQNVWLVPDTGDCSES